MAKALASNASVRELDLSENKIGPEGAAAVAKALASNESVIELNLGGNGIGPDGAAALAKALECNASILTLEMDHQLNALMAPLLERNKQAVRARRDATLCLIAARKFRRADCATTLGLLDKNVVLLIARALYDGTRSDVCWCGF